MIENMILNNGSDYYIKINCIKITVQNMVHNMILNNSSDYGSEHGS
jgi:uncharacterized protein YheU (UPF0270 family)